MTPARFASLSTDLGHVHAVFTHGFAAFAANLRHVLAISAHRLAALSANGGMALGIPVPAAPLPGSPAAAAGALLARLAGLGVRLVSAASIGLIVWQFFPPIVWPHNGSPRSFP